MTKNYSQKLVADLVRAGFLLVRNGRHGYIYERNGKRVTVPVRIDTRKISNHTRRSNNL